MYSDKNADIAELLVNMVIEDSQPFSFVEGTGFKKLFEALAPNYVLPSRKVSTQIIDTIYIYI